jgi:hypothetical protein
MLLKLYRSLIIFAILLKFFEEGCELVIFFSKVPIMSIDEARE